MEETKKYSCPNCGSELSFSIKSQKMACEHCSSDFEISEISDFKSNDYSDSFAWNSSDEDLLSWDDESINDFSSFSCSACGGEIIADSTISSTRCPYCGNYTIIKSRLDGILKPEFILTFKIEENEILNLYNNFLKTKRCIPNKFKSSKILKKISAIYVPFWLFDADVNGSCTFRHTKIERWSGGKYDYTKTSVYLVNRSGEAEFELVPVDGSDRIDNALMESVEPFNYCERILFNPAYLSGFVADKYDVSFEDSKDVISKRMKNSLIDILKSDIDIPGISIPVNSSITLNGGNVKYVLLPVWFFHIEYKGEDYKFAINGQTGKVAGRVPVSIFKLILYFFRIYLIAMFILIFICWLIV